MGSLFRDMFKSEVHTLDNIRRGLDEVLLSDIELIPLMEVHHDYLEESIEVLMSKTSTDKDKQKHLWRFFRLVEMHGKAEEEVLYTELRGCGEKEARLAGFAAQDEHDVAFQLEAELLKLGYQEKWTEEISAKSKVVAGLVQNHIKTEETEIFPLSEKVIPADTLKRMKTNYVNKCRIYLDESSQTTVNHPVSRMRPSDPASVLHF